MVMRCWVGDGGLRGRGVKMRCMGCGSVGG